MQYSRTIGSAPTHPLAELWFFTQCLDQTGLKRKGRTLLTISGISSRYFDIKNTERLKVFWVNHFPPKGCQGHGLLSLVWNKLRPGFRRDWICGHRSRCQNRVCLQITQECSLTQFILEFKSHNLQLRFTTQ